MNKNVFVIGLNTALSLPPQFDINKYLYRFQHDVTSEIFTSFSEDVVADIFKNIWTLLLRVASSPSSTTRLAAYRATGTFLTRITPYYPQIILETFSEITTQTTIDVKSSAVIASAFAYLSTYTAKPKLTKFIASTPVFHHFSMSDAAFSEHLSAIVSNLGHLGVDWLKNLLRYFLERFEESNSRHVIKAINAIIGHQPELFLTEMINFIDIKERIYLSLLAFLICGNRERLGGVDLMPIAKISVATLDDEKSTAADLDCSLQLLSVKSDSFNVIVEDGGDGVLHFKAWNSHEKAEANLQFSKVSGRPSVYMTNLPFQMLVPKQSESVLILSEKFKTLANDESVNVLDVYSVYEPYLLGEYNERSSGAIQGLAFCVNRFLKGVTTQKLNVSLRKVLFSKPVSWFHSFDILRVMKKIDAKLFNEVMGESCFLELLNTLVGFCFSENDSMSVESIAALRNLTSNYNYEKVMKTIVDNSEYFDPLRLRRSAATITGVLSKINRQTDVLDRFAERLNECVSYFDNNMLVFMEILKFFALYQWPLEKLQSITNAALCIVRCSIEYVSGRDVIGFPELDQKDTKYFREVIEEDVATRNVDIITEPSTDYHAFIMPMRESLCYLFARRPLDCFIIALNSFVLFPRECSEYFFEIWDTIDDEKRMSVIAVGATHLPFIGDESVHSIWCQLCINHPELIVRPEISSLLEFLNQTATQCLALSTHTNHAVDGVYCSFLAKFVGSEHPTAFLEQMTQQSFNAFMSVNMALVDFAKENVAGKMAGFTPKPKDSSDVEFEGGIEEALPTKIEDNQVALLFEQYVRHANVNLISKILNVARERKMEISIKDIAFPPAVIPTVASYLAEHQPTVLTLEEAITKTRTAWRPLAVARIKVSPNAVLENFLLAEKIKRRLVVNLNSVVNEIDFDLQLLFKLASKLVFESETPHRFSATLHLLATVIAKLEKIQPSFVKEFISNTERKLDNMDGVPLSFICLSFAQKVAAEMEFIQYVRKIMILCGNKTPANARLQQIFVGVSNVTPLVGRSFVPGLPDLLQSYMTSVVPSRYMAGLRLLEQTNLSVPADRLIGTVRTSCDVLADRFIYMSDFPTVSDLHFRALMSLLIKQGVHPLHSVLFKLMPGKFLLPDSHPAYTTAIRIWLQVMRLLNPASDYFRRVASVVDVLLASRFSDSAGIKCLKEKIGKLPDNEHQGAFMEALISWTDHSNENGNRQLAQRLGEWYQIARDIDLSLVSDLTTVLFTRLKVFWPVFVTIAKLCMRRKNDAELAKTVRSTAETLECRCHKRALFLLLENHDVQKLVKLAEFDCDCEESDKLLAEITGN